MKQRFFWPSRHTRAAACLSLAGFQSGSKSTRRLPPIRLRPQPPALEERRKAKSELGLGLGLGFGFGFGFGCGLALGLGLGLGLAACLRGEEEGEERVVRVVEVLNHLGAFLNRARAVELATRPALLLAHPLKQVERLRVVRDEDHLPIERHPRW